MQNSLVAFTFFLFWLKIPFFDKLGPKDQNCQFKLKFGTKNNLHMQNSVMVFTFSVFETGNVIFGETWSKIKIVSLSWNLVPAATRICRIHWWRSLFSRFYLEILFLGKLGPKNWKCQLGRVLVPRIIPISKI